MEQPLLLPDDTASARSLLDQLVADSLLYRCGEEYKKLLTFVIRLRNFAPFNAMLLQVQKPGLMYAASAFDWHTRFQRRPKPDARPLLILWPFAPVALVYDVQDTTGNPLPDGVNVFSATGVMTSSRIAEFAHLLNKRSILVHWFDGGDGNAGYITSIKSPIAPDFVGQYRLGLNRNHTHAVTFATIAHEMAHLCLGHLGKDNKLKIPARRLLTLKERELEAESVAYIVCNRNGVTPNSERYLSAYLKNESDAQNMDTYQIMRAAGQVEALLALTASTSFDHL
ncbi:hypothetical protein [Cupriavidus oxalaticus]|uniref:IrrE N-terminal-like domain-containing protein n=1 Tax=Cupriavidus oxalaticus TaxID=96344 RepID=A0A4V1BZQ9_9BURK|nr:hypothetical protein [Cupriavidus oxalaticus]QBY56182.1 hypothetical protein E0W60_34555 [Cupriavidus oxalaticus]